MQGGDCSGITWCVYLQAGLPYRYVRADLLPKSCSFLRIPADQGPEPGDVGRILGHVVIYDPKAAPSMDVWSASHPGGPAYGPGNQEWYRPGPEQWYRYNPKAKGCK